MTGGTIRAAAALGLVGLIGLGGWHAATHWHPAVATYPLQGIDLGENPAPVEWESVRARGADFAYIVATAGADRRDPAFEANWNALPDAGLRRGAVHLYSLCQHAADQADAFNAFVPRADDALPAAVDISFRADCGARPDRAVLIGELERFVAAIETHTQKPVLLRIAKPVEATYHLSSAIDRPVWAIGDLIAPGYTARPWWIWRASDVRHIDGIAGAVNWDVVAP